MMNEKEKFFQKTFLDQIFSVEMLTICCFTTITCRAPRNDCIHRALQSTLTLSVFLLLFLKAGLAPSPLLSLSKMVDVAHYVFLGLLYTAAGLGILAAGSLLLV